MKLRYKLIAVFVGGGLVWTFSYLTSIKPELAMILSSANATIVGAVAFITGWQPKTA